MRRFRQQHEYHGRRRLCRHGSPTKPGPAEDNPGSGITQSDADDRYLVRSAYGSTGLFMTPDVVTEDFTVPLGYSMIYPNMSVPGGITVTVAGTLIDFVLP